MSLSVWVPVTFVITARQTRSRTVHWTPSKSHLLRTAADGHPPSVERPDFIGMILRRRFADYQDKTRRPLISFWGQSPLPGEVHGQILVLQSLLGSSHVFNIVDRKFPTVLPHMPSYSDDIVSWCYPQWSSVDDC